MTRRTRRRVIAVLVWLAVIPLLVEFGLRTFDPWGVQRYLDDLVMMYRQFRLDEPRGYVLPPGDYQFAGWRATINGDYTRRVPDASSAPCVVAFLGDSVTFGHGVGDSVTWVNLLARELPNTRLINAGLNGYNILSVTGARQAVAASAYIYLLVGNDDQELPRISGERHSKSAIQDYLYFAYPPRADLPYLIPGRFDDALDKLLGDPAVTVVAFDLPGETRYADYHIPLYTHSISRADGHADAAGNREIAAAMLPIVRNAVRERCTAVI